MAYDQATSSCRLLLPTIGYRLDEPGNDETLSLLPFEFDFWCLLSSKPLWLSLNFPKLIFSHYLIYIVSVPFFPVNPAFSFAGRGMTATESANHVIIGMHRQRDKLGWQKWRICQGKTTSSQGGEG